MFTVKDLLVLLDKWPAWKRITEAPARIDALEARMAKLEAASLSNATDTGLGACKDCGSRDLTLIGTELAQSPARAHFKKRDNKCRCNDCGALSVIEPPRT